VFLKKINDGSPFLLSPKFFDTHEVKDTLEGHLVVVDRRGKNTEASVEKILQWKADGDQKLLQRLEFDTDMVYTDDDWEETGIPVVIGLNKLEKTKEFGSRGGDEPKGADWEAILSYVHNGKPKDFSEMGTIVKFGKPSQPYIKQAEDMLEDVSNEPAGTWVVTGGGLAGSGKATDLLSSEWKDSFASVGQIAAGATATPKTDVRAASGAKMSFKKAGGSQLMSGGKGETMATILAVEKYRKPQTKESQKLLKSFKKSVDEHFTRLKLKEKETITAIQRAAATAEKQGKKLTKTESIVVAQTLANEEMTKTIRKLFEENVIEINKGAKESYNSKSFKFYVCEEALSGDIKFGKGDAAANSLFTFDPSRRVAKYEKINSSVVGKVADRTEFNVSYKTSGTGGSAWTAMKAVYKESKITSDLPLAESLCEYATKELDREIHQYRIMDEGIDDALDSIVDFGKSAHAQGKEYAQKISDAAARVVGWVSAALKKVWKKVKETFEKIYKMAEDAVKKGLNAYAEVFGVEMASAEPVADPDVGDLLL